MIQAQVTDIPGQSACAIRSLLYRLMRLPAPSAEPKVPPVPAPQPVTLSGTFGEHP